MSSRDKESSDRNRWFSKVFFTDGIASSGSIFDFMPLNETDFERLASLLPWVQTCIGLNKIETLTPEGWFEEECVMNTGKKYHDGIWMPYHSKGNFYGIPPLQWQTWC